MWTVRDEIFWYLVNYTQCCFYRHALSFKESPNQKREIEVNSVTHTLHKFSLTKIVNVFLIDQPLEYYHLSHGTLYYIVSMLKIYGFRKISRHICRGTCLVRCRYFNFPSRQDVFWVIMSCILKTVINDIFWFQTVLFLSLVTQSITISVLFASVTPGKHFLRRNLIAFQINFWTAETLNIYTRGIFILLFLLNRIFSTKRIRWHL